MTDREYLELAAKAAGIALYWAEDDPECDWVEGNYPRIPDHKVLEKWTWRIWNPIAEDGDALRLAVKRSILTEHHTLFLRLLQEELDMDHRPSKATRRAIVRAAAEIGGHME